MDEKVKLQIPDTNATYEQFVEELATKVALKIHQIEKGQLEVSQAKAFKMYGRADVERWVRTGKLRPCRISPGKKRYKLVDLQRLANIQQNNLL